MNACDSYAASGDVYVLLTFNTIFTKQKLSGVEYLICIYMEYDLVATIFYCCFCCCFFSCFFTPIFLLFSFCVCFVFGRRNGSHTRIYIYTRKHGTGRGADSQARMDRCAYTHTYVCKCVCEWMWMSVRVCVVSLHSTVLAGVRVFTKVRRLVWSRVPRMYVACIVSHNILSM